jgi:Cu(I)/Ag(I) efflux system membrane fusion protein
MNPRRFTSPLALLAVLLVGIVGGYCAGRSGTPGAAERAPVDATAGQRVWTCSMHPQVRLDAPGKCPICEMPLTQANSAPTGGDATPLELSPHAVAMASVETTEVGRRPLVRELRTVGKVEFDEQSLATITPRVDGYVEKLFVNFTGVAIKKGDHLAEVYSPELLVAQQELLIALQGGQDHHTLVDTARAKLELLGLTQEQVAGLVADRKVATHISLFSPIAGTVIEKFVVEKAAFRAGEPLFRIANLGTVWVYVDVYELDLPWVRYGQPVAITAEAVPGVAFEGTVTFVRPVVDEATRTIRVPVHVANKGQQLKPGMFASVVVRAALGPDGEPLPTGVEGRFVCPMHPQVIQDEPGACSVCSMQLERVPGERAGGSPAATDGALAVPVTAVLDSGLRKLVYVAKGEGVYEPREVALGPRAGDFYPVRSGVAAGERVVTRGAFLIDSQFQITGHPSLLHPGGLHASKGHQHGGGDPLKAAPAPLPAKADEHAGHGR